MAPKGTKRIAGNTLAEEPKAKRVADFLKQQGVSKASVQPVLEAVEHPLADLPAEARSMLLATLPWSLAVPLDQRHEAQQGIVGMVDGLMKAVRTGLEQQVASEVSKVEELEGNKAMSKGQAGQAEEAAVEAGRFVQECRDRSSEVGKTLAVAQAAVDEAELQVKRTETELEETQALASEFEDVLTSTFASLKEVNFEDCQAEALVQKVMTTVNRIHIEESLAIALPSSLAKRERGSFDLMVIGQAEETLRCKAAKLGEMIAQSQEQLSTRRASAQAAHEELEAARSMQAQAADRLQTAQDAVTQAMEQVVEAKRAVAESEARLIEVAARLAAKRSDLESFCTYNMSMFELLRDRVASKPSIAAAIEQSMEQPVAEPVVEPSADASDKIGHDVVVEKVVKVTEQVGEHAIAALAGVAGA